MTAETSHPQHDITSPENLARRERGLEVARSVGGETAQVVINSLTDISPALTRHIAAPGFGGVYSRLGPDPRSHQLVTIGVLTAPGGCGPQLRTYIGATLNAGLTCGEIVEVTLHASVYAGFPRVLNTISVVCEALVEHDVTD